MYKVASKLLYLWKNDYICETKYDIVMSEKEMNSYRLTSMEEPTDEMLAALMKEVAEEAKKKSEEAHKEFFTEIREKKHRQHAEWINNCDVTFGDE